MFYSEVLFLQTLFLQNSIFAQDLFSKTFLEQTNIIAKLFQSKILYPQNFLEQTYNSAKIFGANIFAAKLFKQAPPPLPLKTNLLATPRVKSGSFELQSNTRMRHVERQFLQEYVSKRLFICSCLSRRYERRTILYLSDITTLFSCVSMAASGPSLSIVLKKLQSRGGISFTAFMSCDSSLTCFHTLVY